MTKKYHVYLLSCSDDTIYTGYTVDLDRRMQKHQEGRGAKYTRSRLPVHLLVSFSFSSKHQALSVEAHIKRKNRAFKERIIRESWDSEKLLDYFDITSG